MTPLTEHIKTAKTPAEALMILAEAIDNVRAYVAGLPTAVADPFDAPLVWGGAEVDTITYDELVDDNRSTLDHEGNVVVKPVSLTRQAAREDFARQQRLHEFFPVTTDAATFREDYVKGGPRWLYYDNRAAVMTMPFALRRALVEDVLLDSPSEAAEIGNDILKHDESVPEGAALEALRRDYGPLA